MCFCFLFTEDSDSSSDDFTFDNLLEFNGNQGSVHKSEDTVFWTEGSEDAVAGGERSQWFVPESDDNVLGSEEIHEAVSRGEGSEGAVPGSEDVVPGSEGRHESVSGSEGVVPESEEDTSQFLGVKEVKSVFRSVNILFPRVHRAERLFPGVKEIKM